MYAVLPQANQPQPTLPTNETAHLRVNDQLVALPGPLRGSSGGVPAFFFHVLVNAGGTCPAEQPSVQIHVRLDMSAPRRALIRDPRRALPVVHPVLGGLHSRKRAHRG